MSENKEKPQDPDNVFVREKRDDPKRIVVFLPFSYRSAQAEMKRVGARFVGNGNWSVDAADFRAAEQEVRDAARHDIDLGSEGRKAREKLLRKNKDEMKRGRSSALSEKNSKRVLVKAGRFSVGDKMVNGQGEEETITGFGKEFEISSSKQEAYNDAFPGNFFEPGDRVNYAFF